MNVIKQVCLSLANLVKALLLLPQVAWAALQHRRRMSAKNQFEAERLDRIRNPAKYLGRP